MADTNVRISVDSRDTAKLAAAILKIPVRKFVEDAIAVSAKPVIEKLHGHNAAEQEKP